MEKESNQSQIQWSKFKLISSYPKVEIEYPITWKKGINLSLAEEAKFLNFEF